MPTYFMNSIVVTGISIVLILVLGTMAGYAIARYELRTNTFILLFFLAGLMLPLKLAVIPLFILLRDLGSARQPLEPHRHLYGDRPAVGRVHHGGFPAFAAGRA